jgi:hypothetical protein
MASKYPGSTVRVGPSNAAPVSAVVEKYLHDCFQKASTSDVVAAVLNHGEVAEAPQRCPARRGRIEPLARVFVGPHRDVEVQLLANFIRGRIAPEQRAESRERDPQAGHGSS